MNPAPRSASRRHFLHTAAAGAVLGPYAIALSGQTVAKPAGNFPNFARGEVVRTSGEVGRDGRFSEAARPIPIAGHSQVLVVGAGPAGIGAALAAARAGAKVQVIETAGCLGGVWTAGMLTKIIDGGRKTGIMEEIMQAMIARGSEVRSCSGRVIRSHQRETGLKQSVTPTVASLKSSTCCRTGSGPRSANTSPGSRSTGRRLTVVI